MTNKKTKTHKYMELFHVTRGQETSPCPPIEISFSRFKETERGRAFNV